MAVAFVSPGDVSLLAAGTGCSIFCHGTGPAHRELRSGHFCLLGLGCAAAQPQLGIWVMVSCSGCGAGLRLFRRG